MARVNINIAITAMITEKPLQENHSSTEHICEREYELGISSSGFNFTLSGETDENGERDTFDWTNRQSGLMLGTWAVRIYFIKFPIISCSSIAMKRWILLRLRSNDAIWWVCFRIFWCPENHDHRHAHVQSIEFWFFLHHHCSEYWVSPEIYFQR